MKLTFIGAAHEVTGSCHLLEACGKRILVDCGMEQGQDIYENQEIPVMPGGGGRDGRMRNLSYLIPDHHPDVKIFHRNGGNHDIPQQIGRAHV